VFQSPFFPSGYVPPHAPPPARSMLGTYIVAGGASAFAILGAAILLVILSFSRGKEIAKPAHAAHPGDFAGVNEAMIQKPLLVPVKATLGSSRAGGSKIGVIRVSPLLRGVLVDGVPHAVRGGTVIVSCGKHTVKTPGATHAVDVPCGGSSSI
jgi:hypothetical protein